MRNNFIILLFSASILLLSSCSIGDILSDGRLVIFDDSEDKADARFGEILENITNQDSEALKAMFSQRALTEAEDFDNNMEYLFGLVQGSVDSWESDRFSSETAIEYGKESVKLRYWHTVTTDKGKYMFFISDYVTDTIEPDNAGIYSLRAIRAEDEETQFAGTWQDMEIAGIYKP